MAAGEPSFEKLPKEVVIRRVLMVAITIVVFIILIIGLYKSNPNNKKQAQCRMHQYQNEERYRVEYWNESQHRWVL
jgi:cell division protein FtsN